MTHITTRGKLNVHRVLMHMSQLLCQKLMPSHAWSMSQAGTANAKIVGTELANVLYVGREMSVNDLGASVVSEANVALIVRGVGMADRP